jgi:hypothetical protein
MEKAGYWKSFNCVVDFVLKGSRPSTKAPVSAQGSTLRSIRSEGLQSVASELATNEEEWKCFCESFTCVSQVSQADFTAKCAEHEPAARCVQDPILAQRIVETLVMYYVWATQLSAFTEQARAWIKSRPATSNKPSASEVLAYFSQNGANK